jgi:hypothetical protein
MNQRTDFHDPMPRSAIGAARSTSAHPVARDQIEMDTAIVLLAAVSCAGAATTSSSVRINLGRASQVRGGLRG